LHHEHNLDFRTIFMHLQAQGIIQNTLVLHLRRKALHQQKLKRNPDRRVVADAVEKLAIWRKGWAG
jgi:hypothetical protein